MFQLDRSQIFSIPLLKNFVKGYTKTIMKVGFKHGGFLAEVIILYFFFFFATNDISTEKQQMSLLYKCVFIIHPSTIIPRTSTFTHKSNIIFLLFDKLKTALHSRAASLSGSSPRRTCFGQIRILRYSKLILWVFFYTSQINGNVFSQYSVESKGCPP